MKNYIYTLKSVRFGFVPFCWLRPHREETIVDTTLYCGPFRMGWINP